MNRDALYVLPPGFPDRGERQFCPECAEVWGYLAYYPAIRETLEVINQPLEHPRPGLVARLGDGQWNCPTLVLAEGSPEGQGMKVRGGVRYIDNARDMARYWSSRFGTALPR